MHSGAAPVAILVTVAVGRSSSLARPKVMGLANSIGGDHPIWPIDFGGAADTVEATNGDGDENDFRGYPPILVLKTIDQRAVAMWLGQAPRSLTLTPLPSAAHLP